MISIYETFFDDSKQRFKNFANSTVIKTNDAIAKGVTTGLPIYNKLKEQGQEKFNNAKTKSLEFAQKGKQVYNAGLDRLKV
jgi:surface antigen